MKKFLSILGVCALILVISACGGADKEEATSTASTSDIMNAIKEQMAEDMKDDFGGEEVLVDGELSGYFSSNLTSGDEEDMLASILLERMELNVEDIEEGFALSPMMNVNSNDIIVLKAKDNTKVDSLKEALERELAAQTATWERYLPDQYEKVKNNRIVTEGLYLIYITYDNPEVIEDIFKKSVK
ncbi:DUF4358 domain-containing protein [Sporosarcina sp. CAU 1771]